MVKTARPKKIFTRKLGEKVLFARFMAEKLDFNGAMKRFARFNVVFKFDGVNWVNGATAANCSEIYGVV